MPPVRKLGRFRRIRAMQISNPQKPAFRLSLTPLIDVVFLLLVFFMLASTFTRYTGLEVSGGKSGAAVGSPKEIALVRVHNARQLDLNGKPVNLEELPAALSALAGESRLKVAIKPGTQAKLQDVVDVMERVRVEVVSDVLVVR